MKKFKVKPCTPLGIGHRPSQAQAKWFADHPKPPKATTSRYETLLAQITAIRTGANVLRSYNLITEKQNEAAYEKANELVQKLKDL